MFQQCSNFLLLISTKQNKKFLSFRKKNCIHIVKQTSVLQKFNRTSILKKIKESNVNRCFIDKSDFRTNSTYHVLSKHFSVFQRLLHIHHFIRNN